MNDHDNNSGLSLDEFKASLQHDSPPDGLSDPVLALWHDGRGDWDQAHKIVQSISSTDSDWIHAYLHRKEGDLNNADYWYRRVGKARPSQSLEAEWSSIAETLLDRK